MRHVLLMNRRPHKQISVSFIRWVSVIFITQQHSCNAIGNAGIEADMTLQAGNCQQQMMHLLAIVTGQLRHTAGSHTPLNLPCPRQAGHWPGE